MGMYDHINFTINCPNCGETLNNFQSKDGSCCLLTLELTEVNNFYDCCKKCKTWIEFNRKPAISIKDYDMYIGKENEI